MPDESWVGRSVDPSAPYQVSRVKIREFSTAIGEDSRICHDVDAALAAGHPDVVAPPTFAATITMPLIESFLRDPDFGWDYSRMVHGDQSIVLHRPIRAGDELVTVIHVDDLSTRAGSHMLTLRCELTDAEGAAVAVTRAMLVTQAAS